jgi:hypothetical protein
MMGKLTPENYTREQLMRALSAAGVPGISRLRKEELAGACKKLRGKAREALLADLAPVADIQAKPAMAKPKAKIPVPTKKAQAVKPKLNKSDKLMPESALPQVRLELAKEAPVTTPKAARPIEPIPPPGDYPLPDSYGIDLFHVLVFDPYGAYLFWEISPELLARLYREIGDELWRSRRLAVRVSSTAGQQSVHELYGDRSSFFLDVREPGETVSFELGLLISNDFSVIAPMRTVAFPRDTESADISVRMLEVRVAKEQVILRELPPGEVLKHVQEPLGKEHRTENAETLPGSSANLIEGDSK